MMQIKLFDDDDFKKFETAIARALVRAVRALARDGTLAALAAGTEALPAEAAPTPPIAPPVPTPIQPTPPPPPPPQPPRAAPKVVAAPPEVEPEPPELPRPVGPPVQAPPPPPKRPRTPKRSVTEVCRTVGDRPHGYINTDEARKLMGGARDSASAILSQWIMAGEVQALIVANEKPPTKNLPGRLMVDKPSLETRIKLRDQNKAHRGSHLQRWVRDNRGQGQSSSA